MKSIVLFGATGGLGSQLKSLLEKKYTVVGLSSQDVDVLDFIELQKLFHTQSFDVVLNLSGYNYDCFLHKYDEKSIYEAEKQIKINTLGTVNILANCLPHMRQKKYGRIILASSVLADSPVMASSVYTASKGFIDSIVRSVNLENINKGITCNSLQLGYFDGGMCHRIPDHLQKNIKNNIGLKRWGTIEELYKTVEYLIETEYITGQNIKISGGL